MKNEAKIVAKEEIQVTTEEKLEEIDLGIDPQKAKTDFN